MKCEKLAIIDVPLDRKRARSLPFSAAHNLSYVKRHALYLLVHEFLLDLPVAQ